MKMKIKRRKKRGLQEKNDINIYNNRLNLKRRNIEKVIKGLESFNKGKSTSFIRVNPKENFFIEIDKRFAYDILLKKDFELNLLNYEAAFQLNDRNFCQYYFSLLKYNHPILFSFSSYNDYNSRIIKIFLFFFSLFLDLTINALFFTDNTMHKIYQDKGKYNFLYQIPQILYSALISRLFDSIIRNFAISQDNIVEFKHEKRKKGLEIKYYKLLRKLKIKFIIFFILAFIFMIFIAYYIICFCGIYVNTQTHFIKDSFISIIISLFIPIILCLIPSIFRILSLKGQKPTRKLLYIFSMFIENWLC